MNESKLAVKTFIQINKSISIKDEWISAALSAAKDTNQDSKESVDFIQQLYPYI